MTDIFLNNKSKMVLLLVCGVMAVIIISALIGKFDSCVSEHNKHKLITEIPAVGQWRWLPNKTLVNHYYRDGAYVYFMVDNYNFTKRDVIGEIVNNPMSYKIRVDSLSFQINDKSYYARDKFHVYHPMLSDPEFGPVDDEELAPDFYAENMQIVPNANPKTFKYIGNSYGLDGYTMYHTLYVVPLDIQVIKEAYNLKSNILPEL